jgi:serine protease AprX
VGAIDTHGTPQRSDDTLATYSSKGPTKYDLVIKPDLVAPGSHIVSAEVTDGYLSKTYPSGTWRAAGGTPTSSCRGRAWRRGWSAARCRCCSSSARGLKPADAKAILQLTSSFMPSAGLLGAGAGSVDVAAAVAFAGDGSLEATIDRG